MPSLPDVRLRFLRPWLDLLFWGLPLVCNYFGGWLKAGRVDLVATRAMGGKRTVIAAWPNLHASGSGHWATFLQLDGRKALRMRKFKTEEDWIALFVPPQAAS